MFFHNFILKTIRKCCVRCKEPVIHGWPASSAMSETPSQLGNRKVKNEKTCCV